MYVRTRIKPLKYQCLMRTSSKAMPIARSAGFAWFLATSVSATK